MASPAGATASGAGDAVVGADGDDQGQSDEAAPTQRALKPIGAAVFVLLGIAAMVSAIGFGTGSLDRPGPGLWPTILAAGLILSAVVFLVVNRDGKEGAFGAEVWNALIVVGSIVVFILLFEHVSFLVASVVLLAGCQLAAGARRWLPIALTCVLGTAAAYALFFVVLGIATPL